MSKRCASKVSIIRGLSRPHCPFPTLQVCSSLVVDGRSTLLRHRASDLDAAERLGGRLGLGRRLDLAVDVVARVGRAGGCGAVRGERELEHLEARRGRAGEREDGAEGLDPEAEGETLGGIARVG